MSRFRLLTRRLALDCSGTTILEFAILAPALFGLLLGVFQVGLSMQSYNAIRNVTADTARFAIVEYQKGDEPTNATIEGEAEDIAEGAPYLLDGDELTITVADAATQRVNGAREITITVSYDPPSVLPFFEWASPTITHQRPIFVLES